MPILCPTGSINKKYTRYHYSIAAIETIILPLGYKTTEMGLEKFNMVGVDNVVRLERSQIDSSV